MEANFKIFSLSANLLLTKACPTIYHFQPSLIWCDGTFKESVVVQENSGLGELL